MSTGKAFATVSAALLVLSAGATARAQQTIQATIVRIDGQDLIVDIGGADAREGLELLVYRQIDVRHPVTRQLLRDRFVIGRVRVVQAGDALSIARLSREPDRRVEVGDVVETEVLRPRPQPSAEPPIVSPGPGVRPPVECPPAGDCPACPACQPGQLDPEIAEILIAWRATLGTAPEDRIRIYEAFLARVPRSRFREQILGEIASLRAQASAALTPMLAAPPPVTPEMRIRRGRRGGRISRAWTDEPVEIAFAQRPWARARSGLLHVMPLDGDGPYETVPMPFDDRGHARARVPEHLVRPPGFAYFAEAVPDDGRAVAVIGAETEPVPVKVLPPPERPDWGNRSRVRVSSEYVSFEDLSGRDWFFLNEGDFLYRLHAGRLAGVRVGYGVYRGEGGTVEELDEIGLAPEPAGFTYGFSEIEIELDPLFSLTPRAEVGLGRPDVAEDERNGLRGGFQLRARIGHAEGTHLVLAGETVPEIGQKAYVGLAWRTIERWPMAGEVHVTDQPVNSDELAVRLVYEVGYEATDWLSLATRFSYQGRTIDHAGFGGGLALTFDW